MNQLTSKILEAIKNMNDTLEELMKDQSEQENFNNLIFIDNISDIHNDTQSSPERWVLRLNRDFHKYCWLTNGELVGLLQSGRLGIPKERFI